MSNDVALTLCVWRVAALYMQCILWSYLGILQQKKRKH